MIRKMEKADIDTIVNLEMKIFNETLGKEMFLNELNNPSIWFYVMENDGCIIGYIGGYFFFEDGEILNFLIDEKFQHQGYGHLLFNYVMEKAKKHGFKRVTLEVRPTNIKGQNFYKKHNFKQISIRKHYYANDEDALVMMKELL